MCEKTREEKTKNFLIQINVHVRTEAQQQQKCHKCPRQNQATESWLISTDGHLIKTTVEHCRITAILTKYT